VDGVRGGSSPKGEGHTFLRKQVGIAARRALFISRAAYGRAPRPRRPVFIVGSFRSGTSLMLSMLREHEALRSLPSEGFLLWNTFQHPRFKHWTSDRATADDVRPFERRFIYSTVSRVAGQKRFLDKTPRNVVRLLYLECLFPDATFLLIKRDGRDTVSSMIEGWRSYHGASYRLPVPLELGDYRSRLWSYLLPPGWRAVTKTSIPHVAAFQYASSYDIFLDDVKGLSSGKVVEVMFEQILRSPVREVSALLERLELPRSEGVLNVARNLDQFPMNSLSPPRPGKWRDRAHEIEAVLPRIAPTMARLGYERE
jgi:Sulfotransferase family